MPAPASASAKCAQPRWNWSFAALALGLMSCGRAHPGAAVYAERCSGCHEAAVETRAPQRAALQQLSPEAILRSLEKGSMLENGALLTASQRRSVAEYLGGRKLNSSRATSVLAASAHCTTEMPRVDTAAPDLSGWSLDARNARAQGAAAAGLSPDQVRRLRLRWAFGFGETEFAYSQPALVGGVLYVGSGTGTVYALDAHQGCVWWMHEAGAGVRTAINVGPPASTPGGERLVYFGDANAMVYAVSARTGALAWKAVADSHPYARITGAPLLHRGRLFVPVSSAEEMAAANPMYACCTFRGSIVALDPATGRQLWKTYTIAERLEKRGYNSAGAQMWGPSGAATWSTPTADDARGLLYITTGNAYSSGASAPSTSNAVIALDQSSGAVRWSWQAVPKDVWTISCLTPNKVNCVEEGPDFDFGAPAVLEEIAGRTLLIASQKSGTVYALDPEARAPVWQTKIGSDTVRASITFGPAIFDHIAFVPYAKNAFVPLAGPIADGGVAAVDVRTGRVLWRSESMGRKSCRTETSCRARHQAATFAIPGVVLSGTLDGWVRAYDARDGRVLWEFDTARPFETVNHVAAHGGSINGPGPVVARGMVYVNSGFATDMGGNVLLAFSVDGR